MRKPKPKAKPLCGKAVRSPAGSTSDKRILCASGPLVFKLYLANRPTDQVVNPLKLSRLQVHPAHAVPVHARGYGWTPSLRHVDSTPFDHEAFGLARPKRLPKSIDLRAGCPPVYDQAKLGSCTANAIAAALGFDLKRQGGKSFMTSRLYVYWNERAQLWTIGQDAGASSTSRPMSSGNLAAVMRRTGPTTPLGMLTCPAVRPSRRRTGLG